MKKFVCFSLVMLAMISCLTACNFTKNVSGVLAGNATATPKVEKMMTALVNNDTADAKALMHPQSDKETDAAITQMSSYLSGRTVGSIELKSINVNTSTGTSGKVRQEQASYQVTLIDGEIIYLSVAYLSDNSGEGFIYFQLVLGVI